MRGVRALRVIDIQIQSIGAEAAILRIAYDADDCEPLLPVGRAWQWKAQSPAQNGVFGIARPEAAREAPADDCHAWAPVTVVATDIASGDERDAERLEVSRRDRLEVDERVVGGIGRRLSFDSDRPVQANPPLQGT